MTVPGIATAADYSEAIGVARRAKSVTVLLLLLMLVIQMTAFFLLRYEVIEVASLTETTATTRPQRLPDVLHYLTGLSLLGGITLGIVLSLVLYLVVHIMLVGRLIGVGKVTGSLIWSFVLVLFLFPWQTFMNNADLTFTEWRVPGVFWTWGELVRKFDFDGAFSADNWNVALLGWFRFVGAPLVAIVLLLIIQLKSNRGIRMAMGEDEVLNRVMAGETI